MQDIFRQFFDKTTLWAFAGIAATHGVAALVADSWWSWVPLIAFGLASAIIAYRSLPHALAFAMIEIFVGGHGHLITAEAFGFSVGIRIAIFGGVMLGWFALAMRGKIDLRIVAKRDLPWTLLLLAIFMGFITGFFRNGFEPAFDDMNGYMTIAYLLPVWSIVWTPERKRLLVQVLGVSAVWVASTTLAMWYAFTHLPPQGITTLYRFVRDARLAEATILSGPDWFVRLLPGGDWYFRVFEQGQFVTFAFEFVLIAAALWMVKEQWPRRIVWLHALMFVAIIAGLSRSFWMGFVAGLVALFVMGLLDRQSFKQWVRTKMLGMFAGLLAIAALWIAIALPVPSRPDLSNSPYYRGDDDDTRELAVSSRWNLLGPMMEKISEEPLWGSGFGTPVTFVSDDPRVREINPSGEWTTYRFEWGYHDIWLKMGIPGLAAFVWFFGVMVYAGWRQLKEKRDARWITFGLIAGVTALYATHAFSPYLNHPIGLGFLVLTVPFLGWNRKNDALIEKVVIEKAPVLGALPRPQVGVVTRSGRA